MGLTTEYIQLKKEILNWRINLNYLQQGSANCSLWIKSGPLSVFVQLTDTAPTGLELCVPPPPPPLFSSPFPVPARPASRCAYHTPAQGLRWLHAGALLWAGAAY